MVLLKAQHLTPNLPLVASILELFYETKTCLCGGICTFAEDALVEVECQSWCLEQILA